MNDLENTTLSGFFFRKAWRFMSTQVLVKTKVMIAVLTAVLLTAFLTGCPNKYAHVARERNTINKVIAPAPTSFDPQSPDNHLSQNNSSAESANFTFVTDYPDQQVFAGVDEPAENHQWTTTYHIGKGDILEVQVYQLVEVGKDAILQVTVDSEGRIYLPAVGYIAAADLTSDELREQLTSRLQQNFLRDPRVSIRIQKYVSKKVLVVGAVRRGGIVYLEKDAAYLQDVLSHVDGIYSQHGDKIEIIRGAHPLLVKQAGGELTDTMIHTAKQSGQYKITTIPISMVYSGSREGNPLIYPGDLVYVLVESNGCYYVAGAVRNPGTRPLRNSMTILQAVVSAGDTKFEAEEKDCRIIRTLPNGQEQLIFIDLEKVRSGEQENLLVARNDMIIVPNEPFRSFLVGMRELLRTGAQVGVDYTYDASPEPAYQTGY